MITGHNFIGCEESAKGENFFYSFDPAEKEQLSFQFFEATQDEINQAARKAKLAFPVYSKISSKKKVEFLEQLASEIEDLGESLIRTCSRETAQPSSRLEGERTRTVNQIRMFANLVREGSWVDARIDTGNPDRKPNPKADIRQMKIPLGPVAVFGASNFPLAFSVAGGDTASALAAGCPVIVKAHPSHPATSELIARAILSAIIKTGVPDGTFSMLHGKSNRVGAGLVLHPVIKAVGFTGSFAGGKALFDLANSREDPIPVYAEMGSVNPVFVLPRAAEQKSHELALKYVQSVNLGVGQFCTNPGVLISLEDKTERSFQKKAMDESLKIEKRTMLNPSIEKNYSKGLEKVAKLLNHKLESSGSNLFQTKTETFIKNPELAKEVFGPSSIMVDATTKKDILAMAESLEGQLTASILATQEDLEEYPELISILERKVGRLIINDFPTGVEVCPSMHHGGPFPATTNILFTSVGTGAINRFVRPICYQNFPQNLLPVGLKDENPIGIMRLVNGEYTRGRI